MRVELRRSGGNTCKECGSYELILLPQDSSPLAVDIDALLARENALIRDQLGLLFDERADTFRAMFEELAADFKKALGVWVAEENGRLAETCLAVVNGRPTPFRPFKRRWHDKVRLEIDRAIGELKAKTYLI